MTSNERRNALLEILSMRRFETLENLAFEFGVSKRTIRYDIEILSLTYPIYTVQGNGGGIHVDENYRLGKSYLKKDQQELLERLLQNLNGKDATTMREIIKTLGLKGVGK